AVAAPPQTWDARMPGAGGVVLGTVQSIFVPGRWYPEWLMRVAAHDCVSAGGAAAVQRPIVAASGVVGSRRVLQNAALRCLGCQIQRTKLHRHQAGRLG